MRPVTRVSLWIVAIFILAWGSYLRAWNLGDKIFWRDEAWVATLAQQPWSVVLNQTDVPCPPLFAGAVKLTSVVKPPEVGLRLLPVLCGIALLPLAYAAVRALRLPRMMALAGMALCAGSFMLANWSRELKQYPIEAFLSVAAAVLTFRLWQAGGKKRLPETAGLALICLVGPWLAYGVVFALLPLLAVLIFLPSPTPGRPRLGRQGLACLLILGVSLGTVVTHVAAKQSSNLALLDYTSHWFIKPASAMSWLRAGAYGMHTSAMLILPDVIGMDPSEMHPAVLALGIGVWLLALAGLWAWPARTRWAMAFWTVGPWLVMYAAAVAQRYPFGMPRMMSIVAPGTLLAAAAGAAAAFRWLTLTVAGRPAVGLALALAAAMVPMVRLSDLPSNRRYWIRHDFPAVLNELQARRQSDEPVLVDVTATPVVRYYWAGRDEDFDYVETSGGTLVPLNFDYERFLEPILARNPRKIWLLTSSHEKPELSECLRKHNWSFGEPAARAGGNIFGEALLYSLVPRR